MNEQQRGQRETGVPIPPPSQPGDLRVALNHLRVARAALDHAQEAMPFDQLNARDSVAIAQRETRAALARLLEEADWTDRG